MKFSDMMGKGERDGSTEVAEAIETDADSGSTALPPLDARSAPSAPPADIRFSGGVTPAASAPPPAPPPAPPAADVPAPPVDAPPIEAPPIEAPRLAPSISDVVAELAPRAAPASTATAVSAAPAATATDEQLDTSAWLDGINDIDDDLLPR